MTLVKFDQDIVQVISREQNNFTILTREREVKKITSNQINVVSALDVQRTMEDIKAKKIVYISEYRNLKKYCCI
ncbi:hypothetical protein [Anaerobacillus arseniciselenatis]|uniref:hypothetical protein n=1 Tax=Anaerobacillus arseniciselenatis TaxID=85682 RepID=UPI00147214F7|nr:hypothetical protein [Anaerobacillus arseniciselenatis]